MSEELIISVLAVVLSFVLGLFKEKPGYIKGKTAVDKLSKALADDKLTEAEIKEIKALF